MSTMIFLGHSPEYWLELQARFEKSTGPEAAQLLKEIVDLRGRLSFYEDRVRQMHSQIRPPQ